MVKKIDAIEGALVFFADNGRSNGAKIRLNRVKEIHGGLVDYLDEV